MSQDIKKVLACIGDSHSGGTYGKSWPDFLSQNLGYELLRASSPGAGNSVYIEKLHYMLKNDNVDLVIIQLTDPTRIATGFVKHEFSGDLKNIDNTPQIHHHYNNGVNFRDVGVYTWNCWDTDKYIQEAVGLDTRIQDVWLKQVMTSRWVDYKVMQDVYLMHSLGTKFNKKIVFWSWFFDFDSLFVDAYSWLKDEILYVPKHGTGIMKEGNQECIPNDGHFRDEPHRYLVDTWLLPEIQKLIN